MDITDAQHISDKELVKYDEETCRRIHELACRLFRERRIEQPVFACATVTGQWCLDAVRNPERS